MQQSFNTYWVFTVAVNTNKLQYNRHEDYRSNYKVIIQDTKVPADNQINPLGQTFMT